MDFLMILIWCYYKIFNGCACFYFICGNDMWINNKKLKDELKYINHLTEKKTFYKGSILNSIWNFNHNSHQLFNPNIWPIFACS